MKQASGSKRTRVHAASYNVNHMGDAGEGLIDQDSRIQERMEELERERAKAQMQDVRDPGSVRRSSR